MSTFFSPKVLELNPYTPGEQPQESGFIKLNTNENPYPPSPRVISAIQGFAMERLRLYPDPNANALKQALAEYWKLDKSQVFVGNGSDEVLAHAFAAFFVQEKPLLTPDISYSFYPVYAQLYGSKLQRVPLDGQFKIQVNDYAQDACGVIFPNPNAPTGRYLPLSEVEELLQLHPDQVVLIDEAYIDFGGESAAKLIPFYDNLVVVHTYSKGRSLAGMRIGYALGQAHLIEALERVKNSFNSYPLDFLAQTAAVESLGDEDYFREHCQRIVQERDQLTTALQQLGFEVIPSKANFIFAQHSRVSGEALYLKLKSQKILVRHFKKPRIHNFLRITLGRPEENQALVKALTQLLN